MNRDHFERPLRLFLPLLLTSLPLLLTAACHQTEAPAAPTQNARDYQVRGLVNGVAADGKEIQIHHEAIPEFVGIDGQSEPMDPMTMPFPVADPALLAGITKGDRIRFTFRVDWDGAMPLAVTAIEKLPPETRLSFEKGLP